MILTRISRLLLVFLVILLFWRDSFAQTDPLGKSRQKRSTDETARISGRVFVAGRYQNPKPLPVFKNRSFCGTWIPNESLLIGRDGGLRNAVVALHSLDRSVVARPMQLVLDNKQCAFVPHVQVAVVGSEVLLKNSDPILHTVHARLGHETLFNVGLPTWRQVTKRLYRPGVVKIDCDVLHTWMSATIVITDTPYLAVSDHNGNFLVDELPAGRYRAEIWHEKLGTKTIGVALDGNKELSLDVVYTANGKY
jgi:plastocyanin